MTEHDQIYTRTYDSLKNLYLNSIAMQKTIREQEILSGDYHDEWKIEYLKEWCTIRMCGSRRSGHTSSLVKLIKEFNLCGVLVSPTMKQADIIKKTYGKIKNVNFTSSLVLSRNIIPRYIFDVPVNFIAVDCASYILYNRFKDVNEEIIYNFAEHHINEDPFFVIFIE